MRTDGRWKTAALGRWTQEQCRFGRIEGLFPRKRSDFVMLGVIHRDGDGASLLSRWLERFNPAAITLEFSPYGLDFRKSEAEALKKKVRDTVLELREEGSAIDEAALDGLLSYIDLPYEYTVVSDYCRRRGAPFFPIDMDRFSSAGLSEIDELLAKENLAQVLSEPDRHGHGFQKALARLFFEKGVNVLPYTEEMGVRDRHMRDCIEHLMECYKPSSVLHVCGWQHLPDPLDIYGPLSPKKVFIYDKALCV